MTNSIENKRQNSDAEVRNDAYYFAGQAVMHCLVDIPFNFVSLDDGDDFEAGINSNMSQYDFVYYTSHANYWEKLEKVAMIKLSGIAVAEYFAIRNLDNVLIITADQIRARESYKNISKHDTDDDLAKALQLSEEMYYGDREAGEVYFNYLKLRCKLWVDHLDNAIEKVAETLLLQRSISQLKIKILIDQNSYDPFS